MLLRQTTDNPLSGGVLNLGLPIHDAGSFSSLSHKHSLSKDISFFYHTLAL